MYKPFDIEWCWRTGGLVHFMELEWSPKDPPECLVSWVVAESWDLGRQVPCASRDLKKEGKGKGNIGTWQQSCGRSARRMQLHMMLGNLLQRVTGGVSSCGEGPSSCHSSSSFCHNPLSGIWGHFPHVPWYSFLWKLPVHLDSFLSLSQNHPVWIQIMINSTSQTIYSTCRLSEALFGSTTILCGYVYMLGWKSQVTQS